MFSKKQRSLATAGGTEVEAFAGKRTEVIVSAIRIGTTNASYPLKIVATDCESLAESLNPLQAKFPVGFGVPLVVDLTEIHKMAFKYIVKFISAARDIVFHRRHWGGNY
jgi:hypothetical protein